MKTEKKCAICDKITTNKKYCSVKCQGIGCRGEKTKRVKCVCLYCRKSFRKKEYEISLGRGKYCSRKCNDLHKKETYLGEKNPMFGKTTSNKQKKILSEMSKKMWETQEHRAKIRRGIEKFVERTGFWPGTDPISIKKKEETNLRRTGYKHNWSNPASREKGERTTIERHGKSSIEIAHGVLHKTKTTKIEKIIESICQKNSIDYKKQYRIRYKNLRFKVYDLFLVDYNLLIEADGDYWHANPRLFTMLNETQEINRKNDAFKNELAKRKGFDILRFWESDILKEGFEEEFLQKVGGYGKNKTTKNTL